LPHEEATELVDYVPERLIGRDEQIRQDASALSPAPSGGDKPRNVFIYGKTGVGKTAVMKYVLIEFDKEVKKRGVNVNFHKLQSNKYNNKNN